MHRSRRSNIATLEEQLAQLENGCKTSVRRKRSQLTHTAGFRLSLCLPAESVSRPKDGKYGSGSLSPVSASFSLSISCAQRLVD